jgi:hypothetical protein
MIRRRFKAGLHNFQEHDSKAVHPWAKIGPIPPASPLASPWRGMLKNTNAVVRESHVARVTR